MGFAQLATLAARGWKHEAGHRPLSRIIGRRADRGWWWWSSIWFHDLAASASPIELPNCRNGPRDIFSDSAREYSFLSSARDMPATVGRGGPVVKSHLVRGSSFSAVRIWRAAHPSRHRFCAGWRKNGLSRRHQRRPAALARFDGKPKPHSPRQTDNAATPPLIGKNPFAARGEPHRDPPGEMRARRIDRPE